MTALEGVSPISIKRKNETDDSNTHPYYSGVSPATYYQLVIGLGLDF